MFVTLVTFGLSVCRLFCLFWVLIVDVRVKVSFTCVACLVLCFVVSIVFLNLWFCCVWFSLFSVFTILLWCFVLLLCGFMRVMLCFVSVVDLVCCLRWLSYVVFVVIDLHVSFVSVCFVCWLFVRVYCVCLDCVFVYFV